MFSKIKTGATSLKDNIKSHKAAYAASAVAITAIALQQKNAKDFFEFLEEKGIDPIEFLNPEAFAEMQA
jgi:hypothetical protein